MGVPVRRYKLYIGFVKELDDKLAVKVAGKGVNQKTIDMQTLPIDKQFILIENHQMRASVHYPKSGSNSKNNQQVIEIYNPHEDTVALSRTANALLLEAGYTDDFTLPIICATQIVDTTYEKIGQESILRLVCSDAYHVKRSISISKSYSSSLTYRAVIEDMLHEFALYGITASFRLDSLTDKQLGKSRVFNNGLAEALTSICDSVNHKWYLSAGIIYVEPRYEKSELMHFTRSLRIDEENIKQRITEVKRQANKKRGEKATKGVSITLNLNGNFNNGEVVDISFGDYEGRYKIEDVKHSLDFEGNTWDTVIECFK